MPLKIILLKDVSNLGVMGEVKNVSPGFARNFLLPNKLAEIATPQALKRLELERIAQEQSLARAREDSEKIKEAVEKAFLNFAIKLGDEGQTFGSVTQAKILGALKEVDIILKKENVILEKPIKALGKHLIEIKLPFGQSAQLKIRVKKEIQI